MSLVFFDLATTGLNSKVCDIIQIGAICDNRTFNAYIVPNCCISLGATRVTGFSKTNRILFRYGERLLTISLHQALTSFIRFLASFRRPVYLVAHNASRFDAHVLGRVLRKLSLLKKFQRVVPFYLDTLLISRRMFFHIHNHKFHNLVNIFLGEDSEDYDAYNALEHAEVLQDLYYEWNLDWNDVQESLFHS